MNLSHAGLRHTTQRSAIQQCCGGEGNGGAAYLKVKESFEIALSHFVHFLQRSTQLTGQLRVMSSTAAATTATTTTAASAATASSTGSTTATAARVAGVTTAARAQPTHHRGRGRTAPCTCSCSTTTTAAAGIEQKQLIFSEFEFALELDDFALERHVLGGGFVVAQAQAVQLEQAPVPPVRERLAAFEQHTAVRARAVRA